ncbi:MAG: hypothetical protein U0R52_06185 [Solirubrobacterales bacterium]
MSEILLQQLVVGVVPFPPSSSFSRDALQRLFAEVSKAESYQQLNFLPSESGAQFLNSPEDVVLVTPGLVQVRTPVMTRERAREKVLAAIAQSSKRLDLERFVQSGIKVVAHAPAPGSHPRAKQFVAEQLMRSGGEHVEELGDEFFAGGIKYRAVATEDNPREQVLQVEPLVADTEDALLFIDYDIQDMRPFAEIEALGERIDESFAFVMERAAKVVGGG